MNDKQRRTDFWEQAEGRIHRKPPSKVVKIIRLTTPTDIDDHYRRLFDDQEGIFEQLHMNEWIPRCPKCGREGDQPCIPCATGETV